MRRHNMTKTKTKTKTKRKTKTLREHHFMFSWFVGWRVDYANWFDSLNPITKDEKEGLFAEHSNQLVDFQLYRDESTIHFCWMLTIVYNSPRKYWLNDFFTDWWKAAKLYRCKAVIGQCWLKVGEILLFCGETEQTGASHICKMSQPDFPEDFLADFLKDFLNNF